MEWWWFKIKNSLGFLRKDCSFKKERQDWSQNLLTKWWWRLKLEKDNLWKVCIDSMHNLKRKPVTYIAKKSITRAWCNIQKAIISLQETQIDLNVLFSLIPYSNMDIMFWKDIWCGSITLQESTIQPFRGNGNLTNICLD